MRLRVLVAAPLAALLACTGASSQSPTSASNRSAPRPTATTAGRYADWPAYHLNRARTGYDTTVPPVTGKSYVYRSTKLDGAVYASPLVVHGHAIVATENDSVYGLSVGGVVLWRRNLGTPVPRSSLPCGNIDPLGITGTPVFDPATDTLIVVAELNNPIRHVMTGLNPDTGAVRWSRTVDVPGESGISPVAMQERGALALEGNGVWVAYGGLAGDCSSYRGSLVRVDKYHPTTAALYHYTVPSSREAGMWTPPGPAVDARGYMYQAVGNGASTTSYDYSDSVLKLDGYGHLKDYFSPTTWKTDNANDLDLGSQGATLVGSSWVFTAGKSGTAYVLRQGSLGHVGGQVSSASVCKSFGGTAVVGSVVYVPCTSGVKAVRIDSSGQLHVLWTAASNITGSPVVGGGRVWALDSSAGVLYGLDPSTGKALNSVKVGAVNRFATPALYGHLVYVGTLSGLTVVESR